MTGVAGNSNIMDPTVLIPGSYPYVVLQIIEDGLDFKAKIETILQESGFAEERAAKMDVDDLLK